MVGEVVLFRLDEHVVRPMLVVSGDGETVTGRVFLDWETDRATRWCRDHCFYSGSGQPLDSIMVYAVPRGGWVGAWWARDTLTFKGAPIIEGEYRPVVPRQKVAPIPPHKSIYPSVKKGEGR